MRINEEAAKWRTTIDNAGVPFSKTVLYIYLRPFVEFVERIEQGFDWKTRIYILFHGKLPERYNDVDSGS